MNNAKVIKEKSSKSLKSNKGYKTGNNAKSELPGKSGIGTVAEKGRRKRTLSVDSSTPNCKDPKEISCKERVSYSAPPSPYVGLAPDENNSAENLGGKIDTCSDLEDGEISSGDSELSLSPSEYEKYNLESISEIDEETEEKGLYKDECLSTKYISPCIRLMILGRDPLEEVEEQSNATPLENREIAKRSMMKEGALFIVTCMGGSIGREGNHHVVLLDREIGCSKDHATLMFRNDKFYLVDKDSTNGTFLNGKCLNRNKPAEVGHGSVIRIGNTIMKCHVHPGKETCFECEPGVMAHSSVHTTVKILSKSKREKLRQKEMKRMKNKYGIINQGTTKSDSTSYKDRAEERRKEKGSDNPFEATQSASLEVAINDNNKGFQMLAKMGWKEGEGLGSESNQGIVEPIKIEQRVEGAGLGLSNGGLASSTKKPFDFKMRKKKEAMQQIRKRFENLQQNLDHGDDNDGDGKELDF